MKTSHFRFRLCPLILGLLFMLPVFLHAQMEQAHVRHVDTIDTSADIFEADDPMKITLTLNLKQYQREKMKGEYIPVHFLYEFNDTLVLEKEMRMKARGMFRRSHCSMAPFWLNIRKADVENVHLQDVKRFKVVTNCQGSKAYDEYVLKEYLAYKIYNIISPVSFRVRLIKMKYVDTGRKSKITEGWAFLIEPEAMLADRLGAVAIKKDDLSMSLMKPGEMDLAAMFMYMIGNCDYSVTGRHNMKVLGMPGFGSEGYTPVPYDFDYSGIVDASYALPGENLGISSVRERYYLGPCRDDEAFRKAIEQITRHRDEILQMLNEFEYLEPKHKQKLISYVEEFFNEAAEPDRLMDYLNGTCR